MAQEETAGSEAAMQSMEDMRECGGSGQNQGNKMGDKGECATEESRKVSLGHIVHGGF